MLNSTLTLKEYFRLHGTLPAEEIEKLLDANEKYKKVFETSTKPIQDLYDECSTGYSAEDEMWEILSEINKLIDETKSKKYKERLNELIDMIELKQTEQYQQGEYCKDCFRNFIKDVE